MKRKQDEENKHRTFLFIQIGLRGRKFIASQTETRVISTSFYFILCKPGLRCIVMWDGAKSCMCSRRAIRIRVKLSDNGESKTLEEIRSVYASSIDFSALLVIDSAVLYVQFS